MGRSRLRVPTLALVCLSLASCNRPHRSEGERLARTYCAACHAFPEPQLLDKKTWQAGVLPQMAPRLGVAANSLFDETSRNPQMTVLTNAVSEEDWGKIVAYYLERAPDTLPGQSLPAQPRVDPGFFKTGPFVPRMQSSAIITLLKTDTIHERVFVGEAGSNRLRIFDWNRHPISTLALASPPTDLIVEKERVLLLESGILEPNDQPRGTLAQYDFAGGDSLRFSRILIDSLFRPVFVEQFDFDKDGVNEFLICEYGDNRGRLALYRYDGSKYERQVLDPSPGAIRFEIRDMTGDGNPDVVALFAQGDERIVLFANDGNGHFAGRHRILARFPPVYGSMYFSMHDFNNDGRMDILYVNGDNFDYSRVLKPYHGIRILENDGKNDFHERYFFPVYGAAQAAVADFDKDGDLDILTTSNFAASERHPERGIMFFESTGLYTFQPYAFSIASDNQWNVMATGDLNKDGWLDVIIGAMDLASIARIQRRFPGQTLETGKDPVLFFENRMHAKSNGRMH
jgi:VCBS repeat protein